MRISRLARTLRPRSLAARTALASALAAAVLFTAGAWSMRHATYDQQMAVASADAQQEANVILGAAAATDMPATADNFGRFPYELVTSSGLVSSSTQIKEFETGGGGSATPHAGDEIARPATTINDTLQCLDDAAQAQCRFVADAAHELRSPISSLLTTVEVSEAYPELADWPETVAATAEQARRIQNLTEDLLLLARMDATVPASSPSRWTSAHWRVTSPPQHPSPGAPPTLPATACQ